MSHQVDSLNRPRIIIVQQTVVAIPLSVAPCVVMLSTSIVQCCHDHTRLPVQASSAVCSVDPLVKYPSKQDSTVVAARSETYLKHCINCIGSRIRRLGALKSRFIVRLYPVQVTWLFVLQGIYMLVQGPFRLKAQQVLTYLQSALAALFFCLLVGRTEAFKAPHALPASSSETLFLPSAAYCE